MAKLEDLKKRLYRPHETFKERLEEPSLEELETPKPLSWRDGVPPPALSHRRWWWWAGGGAIVAALVAILFFIVIAPSSLFETQAVDISMESASQVQSGERVTWTVVIHNRNKEPLESATLTLNYPEGARSVVGATSSPLTREHRTLNAILPGATIRETFDGYVFGGRDQARVVSALLEFRPQGTSATFAKTTEFSFVIARSPVSLSLDIPKELRIGQHMRATLQYVSQSAGTLPPVGVELRLPAGFEFLNASPQPTQKNVSGVLFWKVGALAPGVSGTITIEGIITGKDTDAKSFYALLGPFDAKTNTVVSPFDEVTFATTLRTPFLEVSLGADGIVSPGQEISVVARWRNNLPVEVRAPILEITPKGDAIDMVSFNPRDGSFRDQSLIWNASTYAPFRVIPPGGSGAVNFTFKIKSNLARDTKAPRPIAHFDAVFRATDPIAGFEGVDINGGSIIDIKVSTKLAFTARVLYFNSGIPNSGPLPPRVGSETTYTTIWSFANMANDVENVLVRSALPPYMKFKGVVSPADADVRFDEDSGFLIWNVGRIPAGTGFLRPAMQVAFQVSLVPLPIQVGSSPILVGSSEAHGTDTFTKQTFSLEDAEITTDLRDDPQIITTQREVAAP